MALVIILNQEQAETVAGETTPGNWLEPVQINEMEWILGLEVLADPAHQIWWEYLSALPQREYVPPEEQ